MGVGAMTRPSYGVESSINFTLDDNKVELTLIWKNRLQMKRASPT